MARKVKCKNTECKHHCKNDYCDTTVNINSGGRCESLLGIKQKHLLSRQLFYIF